MISIVNIRVCALLLLLSGTVLKGNATTLLEVTFDDTVAQSEFVFEGRVVATETRRSKPGAIPVTYITFEVLDVLKGSALWERVTLGFAGGTIDGRKVFVHGLRMPEMDERGIYFVETMDKELFNPLYGWHQGHFLVTRDASTGAEFVTPVLEGDALHTLSPGTGEYAVPETGYEVAPTIRAFKARVQAQLEDGQ